MTTGIIGGSGFRCLTDFEAGERHTAVTPYGPPSSAISQGVLFGEPMFFIARHGEKHSIPPHRVNYRANIKALRSLGVTHVISLLAVGAIDPDFTPGRLAVPDQLIDYTWGRETTFFDPAADGDIGRGRSVCHAEFTEPFCPNMRAAAIDAAGSAGVDVLNNGTYGVTQGPRFETAAEIRRMAQDGARMVGMTAMPEAGLAREVGICYLGLAMSVNYAAGVGAGAIDQDTVTRALGSASESVYRILPALLRAVAGQECETPALVPA